MLARARSPFSAVTAAVALALTGLCSHASAGPWLPAPGEFYSELSGFRGVADTYYDGEGARYVMPSGGVYERRSLSSYNELGWKSRLAFLVAAPAVSLTRRIDDFHRTETGLGDLMVGFRAGVMRGSVPVSIELDWLAPLGYEVDDVPDLGATNDSIPSLGSGQQELTGWLLVGARTPAVPGFLQAGAGYRRRDGGFANQLALSADAAVWIGSTVLLAGRYAGAMAIGDAETPLGEQSEHVIGPELRVRVDDRLDVFFGSRHVASGENVAHSDGYYMGMAFKQTRLDRLQGFLGGTRRP